ncbi:class I SAM-dependent methyltransferase [Amycolatopsis sp. SID8362]|uniref:class I SAM-dependent methyltransferase n=1 Tax=Amycolatopsis sp. SID8362 TaxID=2690346 RepID=UPI001368BFB9|nr:class I SAM-dependent methyltransferase [Amycolatopsis sp. SID8362]NBH05383.1 methyltransferase domain-containing protein [Amycolatopsis sp. SID8362]NED42083.1 class I SAM-dependent methyltransferase [Amycolatopsis sp. SID8362]
MDVTADGCSVEVYLLLPPSGEPEIVHAAIPPRASILELGSGPGRVTHPLLDLGHEVVAVDDSPAMLAHVRTETVCARIADLDLGRTFDAVLLGSHLINTAQDADRQAMLLAARRHLAPAGRLIVEWHPPEWFDTVASGQGGLIGEVAVELADVVRDGDLLSATARYSARGKHWRQEFTCRRFALEKALTSTDLIFDGWLTGDRAWFAARRGRRG